MRILSEDENKGFYTFYVQNIDDLWYLKNIASIGDRIRMVTMRRMEKQEDMTRAKEIQRKPMKLTIEIEDIEFHEFSNKLKVLGSIVEGEEGLIGEHQSFLIGPEDTFDLIKLVWTDEERKMTKESIDQTYQLGYCFVTLDDEEAVISMLRTYGIQTFGKISSGKTGKDYATTYSEKNYLSEIIRSVQASIPGGSIIIILGPGFTREKLFSIMKSDPGLSGRQIFSFATNRSDEGAIYEFLEGKESEKIFAKARMLQEKRLIEEFLKNLKTDALATYGYDQVKTALQAGAVETFMLTEEKFRSRESRELLEGATNSGASVHVFSVHNESGLTVKKFGGYCAILRYPLTGTT